MRHPTASNTSRPQRYLGQEEEAQLTILRSQNVLITFHFGYENVLILRFKNVKT